MSKTMPTTPKTPGAGVGQWSRARSLGSGAVRLAPWLIPLGLLLMFATVSSSTPSPSGSTTRRGG